MFVLASNQFWKCFSVNADVWLRMENGFSGKEFQLTVKLRPLTRKIFSTKILPSNHFRRRTKRERERERTHTCKHWEREREIANPKNPRSSNPKNSRSSHREPTNYESHHANRTGESHRADRSSIWPDLMIFFSLVLFLLCHGLRNDIIYLFGIWENVRKYEQQVENVFSIVFSRIQPNTKKYFSKHFLKCNKTLENIFLSRK